MTLVLSCLTRDVVYQIADRRLTDLGPPHGVIDDEANKAVVVGGRLVFGYSGLGQIGIAPTDERTDLWLARVIARGSTDDMAKVAERIRVAATEAFREIKCHGSLKRQVFQGVGWFRLKGETDLTPGIITVHNAIDSRSGVWLPDARSEFTVNTQFPTRLPGGCILNSVGTPVHRHEKDAIVRLVRKSIKHKTSTPATVASSLVSSVRWLSSRRGINSPVGPGLMLVSLPKKGVEHFERSGHGMLIAGSPNVDTPSFFYISSAGSTTYFGPHVVINRTAIVGFAAEEL